MQGLNRAVTLGVEGATDMQSQSDRKSLAQDVRGIQDQLLSLANTSFRGGYILAGTATQAPPFVVCKPRGGRLNWSEQIRR